MRKIAKLDPLVEMCYAMKLIKSYRTRYLQKFVDFYNEYGRFYDVVTLVRTQKNREALSQTIPYAIHEHIHHNIELKQAFKELSFNQIFDITSVRVEGIEGLSNITDNQSKKLVNYFKNRIWLEN